MTNPIETAVSPLKSEAMDRAEQITRDRVAKIEAKLSANNWDRQIVSPYPFRMHGKEYNTAKALYNFVHAVTKSTDGGSRSMNAPSPCEMDRDRIEKYVANAREFAAVQYDAFVAKLIGKIGDVTSAELSGNHVWGYSVLKVTKADGSVEHWKTQQIVNVSKLGTLFNQWPTRKQK